MLAWRAWSVAILCLPLLAAGQQVYPSRRLNTEVNRALLTSEVRTALETAGYIVTPGTPPEYFSDLQAKTFRTYQRMVKEVGLTFE